MEFFYDYGLSGLFLASFLAATVLPFSSEALLTLLIANHFEVSSCIAVATLGNWMGGMSSFFLGYLGKWEWIEKYLRIKKEKMEKFMGKLHRYGDWFAFFSFLPGIGDAIAVASGFFRCRLWIVAVSMLLGKFVRYIAWMYFHGLIF